MPAEQLAGAGVRSLKRRAYVRERVCSGHRGDPSAEIVDGGSLLAPGRRGGGCRQAEGSDGRRLEAGPRPLLFHRREGSQQQQTLMTF